MGLGLLLSSGILGLTVVLLQGSYLAKNTTKEAHQKYREAAGLVETIEEAKRELERGVPVPVALSRLSDYQRSVSQSNDPTLSALARTIADATDPNRSPNVLRMHLDQLLDEVRTAVLRLEEQETASLDTSLGVKWHMLVLVCLYTLATILFLVVYRRHQKELAERGATEQAFRESESRFRELFNNVIEGVYRSSPDGRIVSANPALLQMLGYESEEELRAVDASRDVYVDPVRRKELTKTLAEAGTLRNAEVVLRRKTGETIVVLDNARAVRDASGAIVCIEGTLNDITERKRAEEERHRHTAQVEEARKMLEAQAVQLLEQSFELAEARDAAIEGSRLKSEFLANLSHEVRTPMNGVIGMANLLMETPLDRQQAEFAKTVQQSARKLLEVIEDILDYSKLETGQMELAHDTFSLRETLERTIDATAAQAEMKGLGLIFLVQPDVPDTFAGDPARLSQILNHLVSNAVKFTDSGEVTVTISAVGTDGERTLLRFEVEDSGVGIDAASQRHLFQAFAQAEGLFSRRHTGTGLGLAISRQLVDRMGGQIGLESEQGQGSLFWFQVPLERQPEKAEPPVATPGFKGRRALIADDSPAVRGVCKTLLEGWQLSVVTAADATECLHLMRSAANRGEPIEIALLDHVLPGTRGIELAEEILEDPLLTSTRVVYIVPHSQRSWCGEPLLDGIEAMIAKPLRERELRRAISTACLSIEGGSLENLMNQVHNAHLPKILIVEDNVVNQRVALHLVEKLGFQAAIAADGFQAVEAAATGEYGAILMDCQMPGKDGFSATAEIRGLPKPICQIPIIAMTANAMHGDRERCLAAGMDEYISKPVTLEDLRAKLERCLNQERRSAVAG